MSGSRFARRGLAILLLAVAPVAMGATDLSANFDARVLAAHNRARANAGIAPLEWRDDLARSAAVWAGHLARTGRFEHAPDAPGAEPQGENLWAGTKGHYAPESMVGLWVDEGEHYRPGRFPDVSRTGKLSDVGHFTQVMWRSTRHVGCAKARSGIEDVLVCRYTQAGNIVGHKPF